MKKASKIIMDIILAAAAGSFVSAFILSEDKITTLKLSGFGILWGLGAGAVFGGFFFVMNRLSRKDNRARKIFDAVELIFLIVILIATVIMMANLVTSYNEDFLVSQLMLTLGATGSLFNRMGENAE